MNKRNRDLKEKSHSNINATNILVSKPKANNPIEFGVSQIQLDQEYLCATCNSVKKGTEFIWFYDKPMCRIYRKHQCRLCLREYSRSHLRGNRKHLDKLKLQRLKTIEHGGDEALKLTFYSSLSGCRRTCRANKLPLDIDVKYLIDLYHQ